jgi:hypothetical protein
LGALYIGCHSDLKTLDDRLEVVGLAFDEAKETVKGMGE